MKTRISLILLLLLLCGTARAQAPVELCLNVTTAGVTSCQPISASNPLAITGTVASGVTLGTSASVTNPSRSGDVTTGLFSDTASTIEFSNAGTKTVTLNTTSLTSTVPITGNLTYGGGFVNKLRNGQMEVAQRGTSGTVTTSPDLYTLDGWILHTVGASITWSQSVGVTTQNSSQKTTKALTITGLTSNTDVQMYQRIESFDASAFASQQVTMQFTFTNNTSATVTPQISTCFASVVDTFGTCTSDLAAVNTQACTNGSTCTEAYSFPASASAGNGYQIKIDFGAMNANTKNIVVSAADARITPGVATGTVASPPWPELVPLGMELPRNQRYFNTSYGNGIAPGTATFNGAITAVAVSAVNFYWQSVCFTTGMRAAPSVTVYSASTGTSGKFWDTSGSADITGTTNSVSSACTNFAPSGATAAHFIQWQWTASSEL